MADRLQVLFDGRPAEAAFYDQLATVEVEESAELPGAVELTLPVSSVGAPGAEDLTPVGDDRLRPYRRVGGGVAAEGVSCLMNLKERVRSWEDRADHEVANDIFRSYGFDAASENEDASSPRCTVMQRATDAQHLRDRARRSGKLFRVCCGDTAGRNTGYFAKPQLGAAPAAKLVLNPPDAANLDTLDLEWDVARPSQALASVLLTGEDPESGDTAESGLPLLGDRSLAAFAGADHAMEARLTTVAGAGELRGRSAALLREAGWFVKCEGEADLARLNKVLRVGWIVELDGAGSVHSGRYLVWTVRHTISTESHRMRFVLVRNAVGATRGGSVTP
jgi:hypothetical protein